MNKNIRIRFDHNMNPTIIDLKYGVRADLYYDEFGSRYWIVSFVNHYNEHIEWYARSMKYLAMFLHAAIYIRHTAEITASLLAQPMPEPII